MGVFFKKIRSFGWVATIYDSFVWNRAFVAAGWWCWLSGWTAGPNGSLWMGGRMNPWIRPIGPTWSPMSNTWKFRNGYCQRWWNAIRLIAGNCFLLRSSSQRQPRPGLPFFAKLTSQEFFYNIWAGQEKIDRITEIKQGNGEANKE